MKQYLVTALDFTDEQALARRLKVRTLHFDTVRALKATNNFVVGGAILDDKGAMIGSSLIVQFEAEIQVKQWLEKEPYIIHQVWEKVDIKPFKVADV